MRSTFTFTHFLTSARKSSGNHWIFLNRPAIIRHSLNCASPFSFLVPFSAIPSSLDARYAWWSRLPGSNILGCFLVMFFFLTCPEKGPSIKSAQAMMAFVAICSRFCCCACLTLYCEPPLYVRKQKIPKKQYYFAAKLLKSFLEHQISLKSPCAKIGVGSS